MIRCPQCDVAMNAVVVRANPGSLIQLDQCGQCGGVWCDKFELFPVHPEEAGRIDAVDAKLLAQPVKAAKAALHCPRCTAELLSFREPLLPPDIRLMRCMHCDGIWLNRGEFGRYKRFQKKTQGEKLRAGELVQKLPDALHDPKSWVVTGTQGMFAYPQGYDDENDTIKDTLSNAAKLALQALVRLAIGI